MANGFRPGDYVIYRKTKFSSQPGPRATDVRPSPNGDTYNYIVDKFWIVRHVADDGTLTLQTRRGKTHRVSADDPLLRRPNFFERWRYRDRFEFSDAMDAGDSGLMKSAGQT